MKELVDEKRVEKKEIRILDKGMNNNNLASQHCCYGASYPLRG